MVNLSEAQDTSDGDTRGCTDLPPDGGGAETSADGRRPTTLWDAASALFAAAAMTASVCLIPFAAGWFYRPKPLFLVAAALAVAGYVTLRVARGRDPEPGDSPWPRLTRIWTDPPGSWPAACLGAVLSLPLLGFFQNGLGADSDSMRLIASIRHVQRGHLEFLTETQDVFVPYLTIGPAIAVAGAAGARLFTIFSMQVMVAVLAWIAYRLSGRMSAALGTALALLALGPFVNRGLVLPMYPTMLALGSLGTWLTYRAIRENAGWRYAAGGALLLVLSTEAQPVGQLFLISPVLLLVTTTDVRRGFANLMQTLGFMLLFLIPRIIVNLSEGGLSHFRSNRTDYWVTEGYLKQIQIEFWGYAGLGESPFTYLVNYVPRLTESVGVGGQIALILAVAALVFMRGRARWYALTVLGVVVGAMTATTIQPNARYFSPLWPGIALLAGLSLAELIRRRELALRALAITAAFALVGVGMFNIRETALAGQQRVGATGERGYDDAIDLIDDGRGIIGVRSHLLVAADLDLATYGGHLLSEEEYVTYLTWPSDEEVIEVMERHNIGWVMTTKQRRLDHGYNDAWLVPNYGVAARHLDMLRESPNFCRMPLDARVTVYRLGDCDGQR